MRVVSRYSFVLIMVLVVTGTTVAAVWMASVAMGVGALVTAAILTVFWVAARRGVPVPANPQKRIQRARTAGRPLVIHFYSDFNLICLFQRLKAASVERQYRGRCDFIYIDVNQGAAIPVMEAYQAKMGDYLLFDQQGNESGRTRWLAGEHLSKLILEQAQ